MYFGSSEYPFTSLLAFMSGVQVGGGQSLTPEDFDQFVDPAAGKAGIALLSAFLHHGPGLPEPGRSAGPGIA